MMMMMMMMMIMMMVMMMMMMIMMIMIIIIIIFRGVARTFAVEAYIGALTSHLVYLQLFHNRVGGGGRILSI